MEEFNEGIGGYYQGFSAASCLSISRYDENRQLFTRRILLYLGDRQRNLQINVVSKWR
jgi:hypothetical protein